MTGHSIRSARTTDAGKVAAILSAFIDDTPWMPRIHTRAEDVSFAGSLIDRGWVTIVEDAEGVAGFIAREGVMVHALYIAERARGRGYGSDLLALAQNATEGLTLWTFEANTKAQAFYLAHGFAEAERTDGAGNDEKLPDIRYVWGKETT